VYFIREKLPKLTSKMHVRFVNEALEQVGSGSNTCPDLMALKLSLTKVNKINYIFALR
jgi:hypothetical protein